MPFETFWKWSFFQHQTSKDLEEALERNIPKDSSLMLQDLIIAEVDLNYGMKDQNPVELVYFYNKNSPMKAKKIKKEESTMLPERFVFNFLLSVKWINNILVPDNKDSIKPVLYEEVERVKYGTIVGQLLEKCGWVQGQRLESKFMN